ncbi:MAG: hypothetical protein GF329_03750 [Candidatus Lokiarchaeota archaeon]|nr:hypothetical protein [Candidatus Lokiarchaeota archaeon]
MKVKKTLIKRIPEIFAILGWFYYLLITIVFFNYITILMLAGLTISIPTILLSFRSKNRSQLFFVLRRRLIATGLVLGLITVILFPNIPRLPSQIYRRFNRCKTTITPNNTAVNQFRNDLFDYWGGEVSFKSADLRTQLDRLDWYVQKKIIWTPDIESMALAGDISTPEEAILRGRDDCRGQACVMASVLIGMGIDAWVVEMTWHWWVMVYENGSEYEVNADGSKNTTKRYPILMMWNENEIKYFQNIWGLYNGVMITSPNFYGYIEDLGVFWVALGPVLGLGAALYSIVCMGDFRLLFKKNKNKGKKEAWKRTKIRLLYGMITFSILIGFLMIFYFTPLVEFIGLYFFVYGSTIIITSLNLNEVINKVDELFRKINIF